MKMEENVSLREWNSFGLDIWAKKVFVLEREEDFPTFKKYFNQERRDFLILGGGSNILFIHEPDMLIGKMQIKGIECIAEDAESMTLRVGAGENWHQFVLWTVERNLGGIENLSLIPGTVGASPIQNIGAYGVEVKDIIESVEAWHIEDEKWIRLSNKECAFDYRNSIFKQALKGKLIISRVIFKLQKNPTQFKTEYGSIREELEKRQWLPSVKNISEVVIAIRKSKLPDPAEIGNAGSFFKNPLIRVEQFQKLIAQYPEMPHYPTADTEWVKVPAGWLIEKAGWKGFRRGDVGVHSKQALVLVNYGKGTGSEIYALSGEIMADIYSKFGIELEREVNCI